MNVIRHITGAPAADVGPQARVLVVTGQSSVDSCQIPLPQARFVGEVCGALAAVPRGFPWLPAAGGPRTEEPSLLAASWRNGRQFLHAQFDRRFQRGCARLIASVLGRMDSPAIIVAGSCGYQILAGALRDRELAGGEFLLITLGAVGFSKIRSRTVQTFHVQSRWDLVSRAGSIVRPDLRVSCGHMGYWDDLEVRQHCRERIHAFAG